MIAVCTCDIVGSRHFDHADRDELQKQLHRLFMQTVALYPQAGADKFSFKVTQGDEFQFLLHNPTSVFTFLLYFRLQTNLLPLKPMPQFRCGIGLGEQSVPGSTSYESDGPAYALSRQALEMLSQQSDKTGLTRLLCHEPEWSATCNTIFTLLDVLEKDWTHRQRQIMLHSLQGDNQITIAGKLNSTAQNISKLLKTAKWSAYESAIDYLTHYQATHNNQPNSVDIHKSTIID